MRRLAIGFLVLAVAAACSIRAGGHGMQSLHSGTVGGLIVLATVGGAVGCHTASTNRDSLAMRASPAAAAPATATASVTPQQVEVQKPAMATDRANHDVIRDELKASDTNLTFHLVAELPYEVEFAPLGTNALLETGGCFGPIPLLLESNKLQFAPALAHFDHRRHTISCISTIRGEWPNNTWLALSVSSDAGPSSSDIYQWVPGQGWVKKFEYSPWVFEAVPWQENLVLLSKHQYPSLVAPNIDVRSSNGTRLRKLLGSVCQPARPNEIPAWVHAGELTLFGYECDPRNPSMDLSRVLLTETWSIAGTKTTRRLLLPDDGKEVKQFIVDKDGLSVFMPTEGKPRDRVVRLVKGSWVTVTEVPYGFAQLPAPATFDLWGIVNGYLLSWNNPNWAITELPRDTKYQGMTWESVWRRGSSDIWLIGKVDADPPRYFLFNTADGSVATTLPTAAERDALGDSPTLENAQEKPLACAHPYTDLIKLTPFQLGFDTSISMSAAEARRALQSVLKGHPEFRHLAFVRHNCYDEDCIGAVLADAQEAEPLMKAVEVAVLAVVNAGGPARKESSNAPPPSWLLSEGELRCAPPPNVRSFPVPR